MKKALMIAMAGLLLATAVPSAQAVNKDRGGLMGFIAGCCFGMRAGAAYNDGKEIHWREWVSLVPVVNIVFAVWNGIDGMNGMTTADYAKQYGSMYY
jgi:hypothetical protein